MTIDDYWWQFMTIDGYWWLLMAIDGYWWLLMAVEGFDDAINHSQMDNASSEVTIMTENNKELNLFMTHWREKCGFRNYFQTIYNVISSVKCKICIDRDSNSKYWVKSQDSYPCKGVIHVIIGQKQCIPIFYQLFVTLSIRDKWVVEIGVFWVGKPCWVRLVLLVCQDLKWRTLIIASFYASIYASPTALMPIIISLPWKD